MADLSDLLMGGAQPKVSAFKKPTSVGTIGSFPTGNLGLVKKDDLTLDHEPNHWKVDPKKQPDDAKKVIAFISDQFQSAQRSRQEMELEWALATSFFEGRQWYRISSQARNLINLQNPNEPNRYMTINKIRPLIDGVIGKLTQCSPDASAVPLSESDHDRAASDEDMSYKQEAKLKLAMFKEIKSFLFTKNELGLYDGDIIKEQKRLFIDNGKDNL